MKQVKKEETATAAARVSGRSSDNKDDEERVTGKGH